MWTIAAIPYCRWQSNKVFYWRSPQATVRNYTLEMSTKSTNHSNAPSIQSSEWQSIHFTWTAFNNIFFAYSLRIKVPEKGIPPEWHSYVLCGVQGIVERLPVDARTRGMLVVVSGNVPPASGLSSSSALVSAATLATSFINKVSSQNIQFTLNLFEFIFFFANSFH